MAAKARGEGVTHLRRCEDFCCSFKELEDVVAMCFLGFADCWKKIDVSSSKRATSRASCERNTLKGSDK